MMPLSSHMSKKEIVEAIICLCVVMGWDRSKVRIILTGDACTVALSKNNGDSRYNPFRYDSFRLVLAVYLEVAPHANPT